MKYISIFFITLILTFISIPYLMDYLKKAKIVDYPGDRRINDKVIPRMGGIIIYIFVVIALFIFYNDINKIRLVIISSFFVVLCGLWDDIIGLKWSYKFILQTGAAVILLLFIYPGLKSVEIFGITLFQPLDLIVLVLFIIGVMNAVNLMDGLDGLVAGFSMQVMWMVMILAVLYSNNFLLILASALLGSLLGFLRYNAFPAKIFLGDTGSLVLGYFLVVSSLVVSLDITKIHLDLTFSIILLGVPIIDTFKVMFIRLKNGKSPFLPDQNHLHHIMINGRVRHKTTVAIILSFTSVFAALAVLYLKYSKETAIALFVLLAVILWFMQPILIKLSKVNIFVSLRNKAIAITHRYHSRFRNVFLPVSIPLITIYFITMLPSSSRMNSEVLKVILIAVIIMFAVSFFKKAFSRSMNDLYVMINLIIFIICSNYSVPLLQRLNVPSYSIVVTEYIALASITLALLIFIFQRGKILETPKTFLTGLDLLIIISIVTLYLIHLMLNSGDFYFWGLNILETFILYLWYKTVIYMNEKVSVYVYYMSFALPLVAVMLIFLMS